MAVFKQYKGKRIRRDHPHWDDAIWQVEFKLRRHHVKRAVPEARTQKQAEQVEVQLRQAIFDQKYSQASAVTRFIDFVDGTFEPWAKENKRSWRDDMQRAKRLKKFFGNRPLRDITPILIEKLKSELRREQNKYKRPHSPATVNRYLQVLSRILSMACENYLLEFNPMERVKRLREPEPRDRYLNQYADDEEERLFEQLSKYGQHLVALADLDLETGLRLGEWLNARWRDHMGDVLNVWQTKTDRPRTVPLTAKAQSILHGLRQDAPDDELIFDPKRTGRKRRHLLHCFERAVKDAGLGDFHFHDLRRTFATRLRAADVHPYDIADLLGHSVPEGETKATRVTKGYARAVPQRLRDAVSKLEKGKLLTFSKPQKVAGDVEKVGGHHRGTIGA
jgi:integrase